MSGDENTPPPQRRRFLATVPALALLAGGCGLSHKETLRLGFNPWPGYEFFKLAEQLGYYRLLGLDVQLVEFTSLGDSRRAFERQQIDVAAGTAVELLTAAHTLKQSVQAFFLTNYSVGSDYLVAQPRFTSPADLKGKRVAVEPGSLNLLLLHLALQPVPLTLQDVQLVPMSQNSMPGAFFKGEVDAVVVYPPVADELLGEIPTRARVLFDSSQAPDAIIDLLYASRSTLERRATELALLVKGFEMARQYTSKHPDDAYARMSIRTNRKRDDFERDMQGLKLLPLQDQEALLQPGGNTDRVLHESLLALRDAGMSLTLATPGLVSHQIVRQAQTK